MTIDKAPQTNIKSVNKKTSRPNTKNTDRTQKKIPKKITETYLHNAGLYYLQRYAASSGHFKTIMLRKVKRSCMHHKEQDYETCAIMVDKLVEKFQSSLLIDDNTYIRSMVAILRHKGLSTRLILGKMREKSVPPDQTHHYLKEYDKEFSDETNDPDLKAAAIFARRKKLGPFSPPHKETDPQKILAKFARAGFSYDISKKIMAMNSEEIEEILY